MSPIEPREGRWGASWLARIGMAVFLTGLVYLAADAFQGWQGPAASLFKLGLMYGGSLGVFRLGLRMEREGPIHFGRTLVSGGCGGVFYTTFAACYVPSVRLLPQGLLAAALLLACAGWMVWLAERRQSQAMALMAAGMAYYTTIVTGDPLFTYPSNFILAGVAAWGLCRHGWIAIGFTLLVTTYLFFAQWQLFHAGRWDFVHYLETGGNFRLFQSFFAAYWAMFAASLLGSRHENLTVKKRSLFLSLNNLLYWGIVALALRAVNYRWVWIFTIGFGAVLLLVSRIASKLQPAQINLSRLWFSEGLIFITLGLAIHFTGGQQALLVALMSAAFLITGYYSSASALRAAGYLMAVISVILAWGPAHEESPAPFYAAMVGALMIFCAWWVNRSRRAHPGFSWNSTFFSALGLFLWFITITAQISGLRLPLLLAVEAALLVASVYLLNVREIPVLAQFFLMAAHYVWLFDSEMVRPAGFQPMALFNKMGNYAGPAFISVILVLITLALSRWWETQRHKLLPETGVRFLQAIYALAVVLILLFWLRPLFDAQPKAWMAMSCGLAVVTLFYGMLARDWFVAVFGQLFTLQAVGAFCLWQEGGTPRGYVALIPALTLVLIPRLVEALRGEALRKTDWQKLIHWMSGMGVAGAALMLIAWILSDVSRENAFILLEILGFGLLVWAAFKNDGALLVGSLALTTAAVYVCWRYHAGLNGFLFRDLLAFTLLLLGQQMSKWLFDGALRPPQLVQDIFIIVGIGSLWHWVHLWVQHHWGRDWEKVRWPDSVMFDLPAWINFSSSPIVTISWALLGLVVFGIGFLFKERMYRILGVVILGAGLMRAFLVDIIQPGTIYRFLSLCILGGALLLVGFAYSRFRLNFRQA